MAKKKPKYNQNSVIRGALRRAFARSPIVLEVMQASRRESPRYKKDGTRHKKNWVQRQCEVCDAWVSSSKIVADHIEPVVSVDDGFQDWNEFVARLWCDPKNLQRICHTCHDKKTQEERIERLIKKYTHELDELKQIIDSMLTSSCVPNDVAKKHIKEWIKELSKYTSKKKTIGLQSVVQRAQIMKDHLKQIKY